MIQRDGEGERGGLNKGFRQMSTMHNPRGWFAIVPYIELHMRFC